MKERPTVLAVVLTYSAPEALIACITALRRQTRPPEQILVVDNAGRPPAAATLPDAGLAGDDLEVRTQPTNSGPAGGHAAGLEAFLASGHDLAWVMDDDCVPEPDCLALLLDADGRGAGGPDVFRFPVRVEGALVDQGFPAWSGLLVGRDVVERAGVPRAELFWWAEDTEYLRWRIPGLGVRREVLRDARVGHSRARTANATRPAWRYYYEARNTVYLRTRTPGRRSVGRIVRVVARLLGRIVLRERGRGRKLWYVVRGVGDGLAGRLGPRVPVPSPDQ